MVKKLHIIFSYKKFLYSLANCVFTMQLHLLKQKYVAMYKNGNAHHFILYCVEATLPISNLNKPCKHVQAFQASPGQPVSCQHGIYKLQLTSGCVDCRESIQIRFCSRQTSSIRKKCRNSAFEQCCIGTVQSALSYKINEAVIIISNPCHGR